MENKVEIKKEEFAGQAVWVYVVNGQTSMKMYSTRERAVEAAQKAVR